MHLYKRAGSPFWWYDFTVKGTRYRDSTKRHLANREEALQVMADKYRQTMDHQQFGRKPEITLEDAFDRTLKTVEGNTKTSYELAKRKWCGPGRWWSLPKGILLSELTDHHLEDHRQERQSEGLRPNSINVELRVLLRVNNLLAKRYAANQDLDIKLVRGFVKTRFLTEHEEELILKTLKEKSGSSSYDKAHDLFLFLVDTGTRFGEALNARWVDLNLPKKRFEVWRQKTKKVSIVPMSQRVADMLTRRSNQKSPFEETSRAVRLLRKVIDEQCNQDARLVAQRGKATIHSLRDTYASRMVSNGLTLHELAKLLGHSSVAMSAKYGHLEGDDVATKAESIMADAAQNRHSMLK
jgi:integrase